MKKIIYILLMMAFLPLISAATPQVIFTSVNMTINNNCSGVYFNLRGEGINANDWFVSPLQIANGTNYSSCFGNFTYNRDLIPITLSRTFESNDTDMAILLHSLSANNNITEKFLQCQTNLTNCMTDYGYRSNFTNCQIDIGNLRTERDNQLALNTQKQTEIDKLKQHRTILFVVALASVLYAVYCYKKNTPKSVRVPLDVQFPKSSRVN